MHTPQSVDGGDGHDDDRGVGSLLFACAIANGALASFGPCPRRG